MAFSFGNAFYIKLGTGGKWEELSIKEHRLRLGWKEVPLKLIAEARWPQIARILRRNIEPSALKSGALERDLNALKRICASSPEDIWITFYNHQLWWCRLAPAPVSLDKISKYRRLKGEWQNRNLKGDPLTLDQIPGTIAKLQRFSGTVCQVKEVETLRHLLLGEPSEAYKKLARVISETEREVAANIRVLHWKNFETLVDLLFLNRTGWRRRSSLGGMMKSIDLELEDTLTRDVYHVQVKSAASLQDFRLFCKSRPPGVRRSYFVVHTPDKDLLKYNRIPENVSLIAPQDLAALVVRSGLVNWVVDRVKYSS